MTINELISQLAGTVSELAKSLAECHDVLQENFASPDTIEGRRAMVAMGNARRALAKAERN